MRRSHLAAGMVVLALFGGACTRPGGAAMPKVTVTVAGKDVQTGTGSYCWPTAGGGAECADMASMQAVIDAHHLTPVHASGGAAATISFDRSPTTIDLSAGPDEAHMSPVSLTGLKFLAPKTPGLSEYRLFARWSEGDVTWVFLIYSGTT